MSGSTHILNNKSFAVIELLIFGSPRHTGAGHKNRILPGTP
jgi:hypothetical protein